MEGSLKMELIQSIRSKDIYTEWMSVLDVCMIEIIRSIQLRSLLLVDVSYVDVSIL